MTPDEIRRLRPGQLVMYGSHCLEVTSTYNTELSEVLCRILFSSHGQFKIGSPWRLFPECARLYDLLLDAE